MAVTKRQIPGEELRPHPRETTGRPPTWADMSPSGRKQAASEFSRVATSPHTVAAEAAEHASGRIDAWRAKNPGQPDNPYMVNEGRRLGKMQAAAAATTDRPRTVTMQSAANRIAENYHRAGARTRSGDIGLTEGDVGLSSLAPSAVSSVKAARAGRGTSMPAGADWYLSHGKVLADISRTTGIEQAATVIGSSSMSPQNDPVMERQAALAISHATAQNRTIGIAKPARGASPKEKAAHAQASAHLGIKVGGTKQFSELSPEQVERVPRHRDVLTGNVDAYAIGKGGTEIQTGTQMIRGEKGQADLGATGKVVSYAHQGMLGSGLASLGEKAPDANDISEYNRRVHESMPENHPYFEQPTLFGKQWEADPYGRAHSTSGILNPGHQPEVQPKPSRAASHWYPESTAEHKANPPTPHEATTPMDTWMMAQSLSLPRSVEHTQVSTGKSPATLSKAMGSDPHAVKTGGGDVYLPTPAGERKASPAEIQHATFNEINNLAAAKVTETARAAGRNVGAGVPAVAIQSGSWTGYRMEAGKDPDLIRRDAYIARQGAPNAAAPGATPKPGQDVPMFNEQNQPLSYGKTWRPKAAR